MLFSIGGPTMLFPRQIRTCLTTLAIGWILAGTIGSSATAGEIAVVEDENGRLVTVEARGTVPISDDEQASRDSAVREALLTAVSVAIVKLTESGKEILIIPQLRQLIAGQYEAFVESYSIVSEETSDQRHSVLLTAEIRITPDQMNDILSVIEDGRPEERAPVMLLVHNIDFTNLVLFEEDIRHGLECVSGLYRRNFATNEARLELICDVGTEELAEILISTPFTDYQFEVVEFSEGMIGIEVINGVRGATRGSGPSATPGVTEAPVMDDGRTSLMILPFEDPYSTGLSDRAASDIGGSLQRLSFLRCMSPMGPQWRGGGYGGSSWWSSLDPSEVGVDWILIGRITDVDFTCGFTPPVFDEETGRKIVHESWSKWGRLSVSVSVVDLHSHRTLYANSFSNSTGDSGWYRCCLRSDRSMIDENWQAISTAMYVDVLSTIYGEFDTPCFVSGRHPEQSDRAITPLGWGDGLYVEMPMRIYIPAESSESTEGLFGGSWVELCKVTVKEVHEDHSVIECEDKWYEYFEFGEGNNILWPVMPDRW